MTDTQWIGQPSAKLDIDIMGLAESRQNTLTKPPGSLGQLEALVVRLAGMQKRVRPVIHQPAIVVFAADHGIAEEGVSAFPQAVTAEMVRNFSRGGAAISVLARSLNATLEVVNLGTVDALEPLAGVLDARLGNGTANMVHGPAMTQEQFANALAIGRQAVERAHSAGADLFIGGDMGIANTASASAIACALLNADSLDLVGPGTGLNPDGVRHKVQVISQVLARHRDVASDPRQVLRCLGGFEIVALCGAWLRGAQLGLPLLVDGFISSVAALAAMIIQPSVTDWMFLSHRSAEPGHQRVADALGLPPLLDLGLRLGEGSGAALAVPLIRLALDLHAHMATFEEAAISGKLDD